jgi:putative transposase
MTGVNLQPYHRRSIRLDEYDYTQAGAYFVTICTAQRACLFGEIVDGVMRMSPLGKIVNVEWQNLPRHFPNIRLDAFVIMPNHIHGVIMIDVRAPHPDQEESVNAGVRATHLNQEESLNTKDGSPLHPDHDESVNAIVRATHLNPEESVNTNDGSPLHPDHDESLNAGVRATHLNPEESVNTSDGSPLHPDHNESLNAGVRATHLNPEESVNTNDGSPLHPDHDESVNAGVRATHPDPEESVNTNDGSPHLQSGSLGAIVGQFKSRATKRIWAMPGTDRPAVWQRNYYEHIIRNEREWDRIRKYILENPTLWAQDQLHPAAPPNEFNQGDG